jgi:hypothetical protein
MHGKRWDKVYPRLEFDLLIRETLTFIVWHEKTLKKTPLLGGYFGWHKLVVPCKNNLDDWWEFSTPSKADPQKIHRARTHTVDKCVVLDGRMDRRILMPRHVNSGIYYGVMDILDLTLNVARLHDLISLIGMDYHRRRRHCYKIRKFTFNMERLHRL